MINGYDFSILNQIANPELAKKKEIEHAWFCPECGSEDVEYKMWVKINTGETQDAVDGEPDWCCDCMEHIKAEFSGDYFGEDE